MGLGFSKSKRKKRAVGASESRGKDLQRSISNPDGIAVGRAKRRPGKKAAKRVTAAEIAIQSWRIEDAQQPSSTFEIEEKTTKMSKAQKSAALIAMTGNTSNQRSAEKILNSQARITDIDNQQIVADATHKQLLKDIQKMKNPVLVIELKRRGYDATSGQQSTLASQLVDAVTEEKIVADEKRKQVSKRHENVVNRKDDELKRDKAQKQRAAVAAYKASLEVGKSTRSSAEDETPPREPQTTLQTQSLRGKYAADKGGTRQIGQEGEVIKGEPTRARDKNFGRMV
jgi:hypothetical protein